MKTVSQKQLMYYGLGALAVYWLLIRKDPITGQSGLDSIASNIGKSAGSAPVNLVTGAATGAVESIGQAVGIPVTNQTQCQKDIAEGNAWAASFDCTASEYYDAFVKPLF